MSRGTRLEAEHLRYIAAGNIGVNFSALSMDGAGLTPALINPSRLFILQNNTNGHIIVSFDGINPQMRLTPGQAFTSDVMANTAMMPEGFFLPKNSQVWVAQSPLAGDTAPTLDYVTFSCFFAAGDGGGN